MLEQSEAVTRLPVQGLSRARAFYAEKLGLEPVEERPGGLHYRCGDSFFVLFASAGAPSGTHTQMGWEVADIEAVVAELQARGVVFEEYDLPGLKTVDSIAEIAGNYPSKGGVGERGTSGTATGTCSASASRYAEASPGRSKPSQLLA